MKYRGKVRYRVEYTSELEFEVDTSNVEAEAEAEGLSVEEFLDDVLDAYYQDAVSGIDIPETADSDYCKGSFEVIYEDELEHISPLNQLAEQAE